MSNFTAHHLQDALDTGVEIGVNQVEFHPSFNQKDLKDFCDSKGVLVTAFTPLGQGKDLALDIVKKLSWKYNKGSSQVILNWLIAKGINAIPRSGKKEYIKDNFGALDWEMETEDVGLIDNASNGERIINTGFSEFDY